MYVYVYIHLICAHIPYIYIHTPTYMHTILHTIYYSSKGASHTPSSLQLLRKHLDVGEIGLGGSRFYSSGV